jgi:hypothetical protein
MPGREKSVLTGFNRSISLVAGMADPLQSKYNPRFANRAVELAMHEPPRLAIKYTGF